MSGVAAKINAIREAGSRKAKQALLKQFYNEQGSILFQLAVKFGMEPTLMFNVGKRSVKYDPKKSRHMTSGENRILLGDDFRILQDLADRKINRTQGAQWATERVHELEPDEAQLLINILDKDLSWGLGASSVNEVVPGLLTEFHCMLAAPFDAMPGRAEV